MLKNLSFLTPASALALASILTACVLVTDDTATQGDSGTTGDGDGDTGDGDGDATTGDGDGDQTGDGDGDQTGDGDGDQTGDGDGDAGDGDGDAPGVCGWDAAGEPPGYYCDGSGSDPDGLVPIECPEGLVEGAECGELTGAGCCDADGNNWYCGAGDPETVVFVSCAG